MKMLKRLLITVVMVMSLPCVLKAENVKELSPAAQEYAKQFNLLVNDSYLLKPAAVVKRLMEISEGISLQDLVAGLASQKEYTLAYDGKNRPGYGYVRNAVLNILPMLEKKVQDGHGHRPATDFM